MTIPFSTFFGRANLVGLVLRVLLMSIVLSVCFGFSFLIRNVFSMEVPNQFLTIALLVVLVPMVVGLVLSEYPRGDDYAMMRIGFATFCRTGLPLVVVMLIARYSDPSFAGKSMVFVLVFYAVGLIASIGLSLCRFSSSSSSPKSEEVDRAAA